MATPEFDRGVSLDARPQDGAGRVCPPARLALPILLLQMDPDEALGEPS